MAAGLEGRLEDMGQTTTVIAPSDAAFDSLAADVHAALF